MSDYTAPSKDELLEAFCELRKSNNKLILQRDDARAAYHNLYHALVATNEANTRLARELQAHHDEITTLTSELDDITAQNDRLQEQHAADLCRIDELEAQLAEQSRPRPIAELKGTR